MHRRVQTYFILFAWLLATGCQWDAAQLVAWGRMFAGYSHDMSLVAAAEKTFSGEMCDLCRAVQKSKRTQDNNGTKTPGGKIAGKVLDLFPLTPGAAIVSPARESEGFVVTAVSVTGEGRASPPSPPPRGRA